MTIAPRRFIYRPTGSPVVEVEGTGSCVDPARFRVRVVRDGRPSGDPFLAGAGDLDVHVPSSPYGAPEPLLPEVDGEDGRFSGLLLRARPPAPGPLAGLVEGLPPGTVLELKVALPREAPG